MVLLSSFQVFTNTCEVGSLPASSLCVYSHLDTWLLYCFLLPSVFHLQPPPRPKLDSYCRNTSKVRSSKGQRMKKRPPRSVSTMLTFGQTYTNWQKEEERKEQSVLSGWVTFSPATNQATGTSVRVSVWLCAGIYYVRVFRGVRSFSANLCECMKLFFQPMKLGLFCVRVHVDTITGGRQRSCDSVELCMTVCVELSLRCVCVSRAEIVQEEDWHFQPACLWLEATGGCTATSLPGWPGPH